MSQRTLPLPAAKETTLTLDIEGEMEGQGNKWWDGKREERRGKEREIEGEWREGRLINGGIEERK